MKLSLVFITAGLVAASTACTSRDRTEVERTTTITSAPMDPPPNVATAAEPNVAAAPASAPEPIAVPREVTPPAQPATPSTTTTAATATAAPAARTTAATTRPARNSDLVDRGQLVGPSMAPPQQPVVIFSNGPGASGSADFVQPSAASKATPSDFSPKPRSVGPTSTAGQGQMNFNVGPTGAF